MSEEEKEKLIVELKKLPGVGSGRAGNLYDAGYRTLEDIRNASIDELVKVPRITPTCARAIKDYVAKKVAVAREVEVEEAKTEEKELGVQPIQQPEPQKEETKIEPEPITEEPKEERIEPSPLMRAERKEPERKLEVAPQVFLSEPKREIVQPEAEPSVIIQPHGIPPIPRTQRSGRGGKFALISVGIVLLIVFAALALFFKATLPEKSNISIDGNFDDWLTVPQYTDSPNDAVPKDIDIIAYTSELSGKRLSFYVQVRGAMMGSVTHSGANVTELLLDTDASDATGYHFRGIGADYRISILGWDSTIKNGDVYRYSGGNDQSNWAAWTGTTASLRFAKSGSQLEAQVNSDAVDINGDYRIAFYSGDSNGYKDYSEVSIGEKHGALLVTQSPLGSIINQAPAQKVLKIDLKAKGKDIQVSSLSLKSSGPAPAYQHNVLVPVGETKSMEVTVDANSLPQSTEVKVWLEKAGDVEAECGSVTLIGTGGNSYVVSAPPKIVIDGLFDDWTGVTSNKDTDAVPVKDKNIDIDTYKTSQNCAVTGTIAYYLKVTDAGTVMAGTPVPGEPSREKTGGGAVQKINGEDVARVFIDSDNNQMTGYIHGGVGADYKIEIIGIEGKISSKKYYRFNGTSQTDDKWQERGDVKAETGNRELEMAINKADIGNPSQTKLYFEMSNWEKETDGAGSFVIPDPIILTDTGHVYSSLTGAGYDATELLPGLSGTGKTFVDLTYSMTIVDTYYALANDGTAYVTTDGGYNWNQVVAAWTPPKTTFRAIATDSAGYLYATTAEYWFQGGQAYGGRAYTNDGISTIWTQRGNIRGYQSNRVICDMTYVMGTGLSATLYAVLDNNVGYLRYSTDSGQTWQLPTNGDSVGGTTDNVALTVMVTGGPIWIYVLQADGNVRYGSFDPSYITWNDLPNGPMPGNTAPADIVWAMVGGNSVLIGICVDGHTYAYDFNSQQWYDPGAPGTINGQACAIIPPAISEFSDIAIPAISIVGLLVIARKLSSKKRKK